MVKLKVTLFQPRTEHGSRVVNRCSVEEQIKASITVYKLETFHKTETAGDRSQINKNTEDFSTCSIQRTKPVSVNSAYGESLQL